MDVIVAARLSQDYSGQTGIESQDEDTVSWAREQGHNVVAVIPDHKSGAVHWTDRKKLRPWLTEPAKLVQYQGIIAARQDRLSRGKWRDEIAIRTWAEDHGKEIFIVDSGLHWPPRDIGEQIRWELDASRARQRWEEDSKQYSRMQKWLRDNGYLVGRPPYGFRVVGVECGKSPCACESDHKTLEPDPETSEIVRQMVDMYLTGSTRREIALWLDAHKVPVPNRKKGRQRGQKWTGHGVMVILRNETLIGKRKDSNGQKDGKAKVLLRFEPIISKDKWDRLQAAIDARRRGTGGVRSHENTSMLAGVAYCATCHGPLHYRQPRKLNKNGTVYVWRGYRCDGTETQRSTCGVMINAPSLDGWVTGQMTTTGVEDAIGDLPVTEVKVVSGRTYEDEIEQVEDRLRALDFDAADYEQRHRELLAERKRYLKLRETAKPELQREETGETVAQRWLRMNDLERRDYLLRAGVKVYAVGKTPEDGWELYIPPDGINMLAD